MHWGEESPLQKWFLVIALMFCVSQARGQSDETGGMRRCHLRGRQNILKLQLIHVGAFNLSLILRKLLGAGTPRELKNRAGQMFSRLLRFVLCRMMTLSVTRRLTAAVGQPLGSSFRCCMPRHRSRNMSRSATAC